VNVVWSASEIQQRMDIAVEWLRTKVAEAKAQGVVVGISGGVDSAVVSGLCKRAFPEHSLGVIMPALSDPRDVEDARLVAQTHGIKVIEIDLSQAHAAIMDQIQRFPFLQTENVRVTQGNLKARLRMATLYAVANALNYLVVGTDNAAESYTGYFTKYGDGGVDLLPLGSLTKTEVRAWAKAMGLPDRIVNRVPTAGLWPGQTDEDEMGLTYDLIDRYLIGKEIPEEAKARIEHLHRISEHKRNTPPMLELPQPKELD